MENTRLAAEIERQTLASLMGQAGAERLKKRHIRSSESVDRLLVIADGEELSGRHLRAGQQLDQLHLDWIGVLQFVDEQKTVALLQASAKVLPISEQITGKDEQVVKIDNAVQALAFLVSPLDLRRHSEEALALLDGGEQAGGLEIELLQLELAEI